MSELSFTKTFLSTLDSRPIKLRPDHVFDPEQIGLRVPVSFSFSAGQFCVKMETTHGL